LAGYPLTPKHGCWLDIDEIELSFMTRHYLKRWIDRLDKLRQELSVCMANRNASVAKILWHFISNQSMYGEN